MQGADDRLVDALRKGDLEHAPLPRPERKLLEFVAQLTRTSYRISPADTADLRAEGWRDPAIAEAVYVTAMFAWFNRVADAFGLADPGYLDRARRGEDVPIPAQKGQP
ncbi:MAG: hypothetical protein CMJ59_16945 [Planctomycetaceae bacterium]|nr:hypothetical protein [Planctomycetaceae bacterium]